MSSRLSHSGTGERREPAGGQASPGERRELVVGHASAEGWTPVEYSHSAHRHASAPRGRPGSVQHRRAVAARARRRRTLAIDLAIGLTLALGAIVLAPGLAIVALLVLIGLLACVTSLAYGWLRGRKAARRRPPRAAPERTCGINS